MLTADPVNPTANNNASLWEGFTVRKTRCPHPSWQWLPPCSSHNWLLRGKHWHRLKRALLRTVVHHVGSAMLTERTRERSGNRLQSAIQSRRIRQCHSFSFFFSKPQSSNSSPTPSQSFSDLLCDFREQAPQGRLLDQRSAVPRSLSYPITCDDCRGSKYTT